jgi:hypothetical protein
MAPASTADRLELRRSLINLGSVMLLMVLCTGIAGLFAVWSLNAFHQRAERTLIEGAATVDHSRRAQASFKTQIQEWKNILLRGHDTDERERYLAAFQARKQETVTLLQALPERLAGLTLTTRGGQQRQVFQLDDTVNVPGIIAEVTRLNLTYERALEAATAGGAWQPALADRIVKGADRNLGERLDAIPLAMVAASNEALDIMRDAERDWFETLSQVIWVVIVAALMIVALVLWRILRQSALTR